MAIAEVIGITVALSPICGCIFSLLIARFLRQDRLPAETRRLLKPHDDHLRLDVISTGFPVAAGHGAFPVS